MGFIAGAPQYLEHACDSPFMIMTFQVRPEKRAVIPGVTHVDGSVRVQALEEEIRRHFAVSYVFLVSSGTAAMTALAVPLLLAMRRRS